MAIMVPHPPDATPDPSPLTALCQHDRIVGIPNLGGPRECHQCDWCPTCESVRRYDGETCTACGREWGSE